MSKIGGIVMICKKCGQEVDKKAVVCTQCGCKIKKPIYKKWWFWFILIIAAIAIISSSGNDNSAPDNDASLQGQEEIVYESVDLQTMFDDLESNAMKAENNYKNKATKY